MREARAGGALRVQVALAQAATSLLGTLDLQGLLVRILDAARQAVPHADKGGIALFDEATETPRVSHTNGYKDPRIAGVSFPVTRGYAARCFGLNRPLIVADAREDPDIRYDGDIDEMTLFPQG